MIKKIEVDTKTFVRFWLVILGFILIGLFIWKAGTGLIVVGISAFLAIAIRPLVTKIDRFFSFKKTTAGSVIAYLLVILAIGFIITFIGPVIVREIARFASQAPETFNKTIGGWNGINSFGESIGIYDLKTQIISGFQGAMNSVLNNIGNLVMNGVGTVTGTIANIAIVLVLTLLFLLEGPKLIEDFWKLVLANSENKKKVNFIHQTFDKMTKVISTYVSKQVLIAILDGCVVSLTVFILSLIFGFSAELAVPMGLVALIFYLIPMFGPIIGCIIIAIIIFFNAPLAGLIYAAFYIVYSQIEGNFIAPKIQGSALKLPPVIILVSITIGMFMFGLIGAIIAIPVAGCIKVLIEELPKYKLLRAAEKIEKSNKS